MCMSVCMCVFFRVYLFSNRFIYIYTWHRSNQLFFNSRIMYLRLTRNMQQCIIYNIYNIYYTRIPLNVPLKSYKTNQVTKDYLLLLFIKQIVIQSHVALDGDNCNSRQHTLFHVVIYIFIMSLFFWKRKVIKQKK